MSEPNVWDKITAYVAENERIAALEAEIQQMNNFEDSFKRFEKNLQENQRLDCFYDDKPLGFKKDPMGPMQKIQAQDPLEEVDLGDGSIKKPTYISAYIDKGFKAQTIELLKEYKDCFAWDYNEMPGLSRNVVELKLPIRLDKKSIIQTPRRFAPEVLSKIKTEVDRLLKSKFIMKFWHVGQMLGTMS